MTGLRILVAWAGLLAAQPAFAARLEGTWLRGDGNARVRIAACGDKLCATNLWIGDTSQGEAVGDRLIMTLTPDGQGSYSGQAYDPKRGWSFSLTIAVMPGSLQTRGCLLGRFICRDVSWRAAD